MATFAAAGLGATLAPGVVWARMQDAGTETITPAMVSDALKLSGIDMTDDEQKALVDSANQNLKRYKELRAIHIPNDVSPPFHFSPVTPGMTVNRAAIPFTLSKAPSIKRPSNLEDAAFWPVRHLAELLKTRQVTSLELTEMYLARLHRYNGLLNNVVTFLDDYGRAEARHADTEIAAGRYKGPLHGIPWGAKDIISVKGFKTTWGSPAFKEQSFDYDASVIEMLRDAGAVLIAKLATGELAGGDQWFGGQTRNPWDPTQGSSGSSAGPSSATAAGCVAFGIGTETSGSILSPSARCGLAGLRPTFGRVSRYGVMALSWTQDRLGPICRYAEDCAIVMQAIARPDGRDMSVTDLPFNWNAQLDIRKLRVGIIEESVHEITNAAAKNECRRLARASGVARREKPDSGEGAGGTDEYRWLQRRVNRVLRRARARGRDENRARWRENQRPAGARGGVSTVAARSNDDDDEARRCHCARGRLHRRVEQHRGHRHSRRTWRRPRCSGRAAAGGAAANAGPAAFEHGQPGVLSGDQCAERFQRHRQPDQFHHFRPTVWRDGDSRAREGVSGRRGIPPAASAETADRDGLKVGSLRIAP